MLKKLDPTSAECKILNAKRGFFSRPFSPPHHSRLTWSSFFIAEHSPRNISSVIRFEYRDLTK